MAPRLWLVTPVHGRAARTRLCLEQRARLIVELAGRGLDAHQVIVGNDENLDTARELGFHVLERENLLGLRINDGFEFACREGEADYVVYTGSDDWLLPDFLVDLPTGGRVRSSKWQSYVSPDGKWLASMPCAGHQGAPPWTIPRALIEEVGFRPAKDGAMSGLDSYITHGLTDAQGRTREDVFEYHPEDDPLRCVDFKGTDEQITPYRWVVSGRYERPDPFKILATRYPADLCRRMEEFYAA